MTPPWIVPNGLAWPGSVMIARLIREADAGFGGRCSSINMSASFSGTQLIVAAGLGLRWIRDSGQADGLPVARR